MPAGRFLTGWRNSGLHERGAVVVLDDCHRPGVTTEGFDVSQSDDGSVRGKLLRRVWTHRREGVLAEGVILRYRRVRVHEGSDKADLSYLLVARRAVDHEAVGRGKTHDATPVKAGSGKFKTANSPCRRLAASSRTRAASSAESKRPRWFCL